MATTQPETTQPACPRDATLPLRLRCSTPQAWVDLVTARFDDLLIDHAACERKASAMGMSFVVRYPDKPELVAAMIRFAREELEHFERVYRKMAARNLCLGPDVQDPYVGALLAETRHGSAERLLDRLVVCAIVEARGCERFGLLASALPPGPDRDFYAELQTDEARHRTLFLRLAQRYFPRDAVAERLDTLLAREARAVEELPLRAAFH